MASKDFKKSMPAVQKKSWNKWFTMKVGQMSRGTTNMLGNLFGKSYVEDVGGFDLLPERLQVLWAAACETAETIDPSDRSLQLIEYEDNPQRKALMVFREHEDIRKFDTCVEDYSTL